MSTSKPSARRLRTRPARQIDDLRLASYLMYPKVFADFLKTQDRYGPTAVLPTPVYFYGLDAGRGDLRRDRARQDDGRSTISAAPRPTRRARSASSSISTASRAPSPCRTGSKVGEVQVRAKAALGDPKQVGAPMPGVISALAGQGRRQGRRPATCCCSIEAMKMETAIHAEADGVVAEAARSSRAIRSTPRICWCGWSRHFAPLYRDPTSPFWRSA